MAQEFGHDDFEKFQRKNYHHFGVKNFFLEFQKSDFRKQNVRL